MENRAIIQIKWFADDNKYDDLMHLHWQHKKIIMIALIVIWRNDVHYNKFEYIC